MTGERYARAFARALHGAAADRGEEPRVKQDAQALEQLWQVSPEWRRFCRSRLQGGARVRVERVRQLFETALSNTVMRFLEAVARHDQLALLPHICTQYHRLEARARECSRVRIFFACDPTAEQIDRVRVWVAATRGPTMDVTVRTSPELLAGLRLFVDDTRVDASLAGRLTRLRVGLRNPMPAEAGENVGGIQV